MKKKFWGFVHNCFIHPAMGIAETLYWGDYFPHWLEDWHTKTAKWAGYDSP
jgi:hypothetical protein